MKKKILYYILPIIIVFAVSVGIYDWNHISKKEFKELVKKHPVQERLKFSKKQRKKMGIPPNKYFDAQYLLEMDPKTGKTRPENLLKIRNNKNLLEKVTGVPGQNRELTWEERGPNNIGGRTRVVFYDPNDVSGKRVFAGGVSGGLWVNNDVSDANSMWYQVGIDENLAVSCFAIDPNDSNIWYIGTGEAYTQGDGVGNGIWRTTNGGASWENIIAIDLDDSEVHRPYFINQIVAWDLGGITKVFLSIDGQFDQDPVGFQKSGWWILEDDALKAIEFLTPNKTPYVFSDVEIAKDNSLWVATKNNLFGDGGGKIFRSIDGYNFTEKYSFANGDRVELSTSKKNKDIVYALSSTNNDTQVELVKTIDGNNFTEISKPNDVGSDIPNSVFTRDQGFYNLTIEIDPENDAIVYAGGINLFQSIDGGVSWSQISKWSNNFGLGDLEVSLVHADQHAVAFNSLNSNTAIFANDGGIYFCADLENVKENTNAIQGRNLGYNITQFYSGAIGQNKNNEMLLGGAQDNGSLLGVIPQDDSKYTIGVNSGVNFFIDLFSGDGIETFIDKEGKYIIYSYLYNEYELRKLPIDNTNESISISMDQSSGSFVNVADLDHNLDILYTDGSFRGVPRISRFSNLLSSPLRRNFNSRLLSESPTAIKVSPFTKKSSTVFIGTQGASLLKVTNINTNNPTWSSIDLNDRINTGAISDIDFGRNENEILVTLHNYGVNNIYYTKDGGITWAEKDGNFPDIPVKAIKMNPLVENEVIIGTNAGVWRTENFLSDKPSWKQSQNGMSSVKVTKFDMRTSDNTVLAATYGRGLFTSSFTKKIVLNLQEEIDIKTVSSKNGEITFNFSDKISSLLDVTFFKMTGAVVGRQKIDPNDAAEQTLTVSFVSGVYIVTLSSDQGNYSKKIMITNK